MKKLLLILLCVPLIGLGQSMDIILEWEGVSGIIKLILIFLVPLAIGFIIGRKTK
tara:strand:- start:239 stop:403 length:165 start_codon:yes stop_codon:yes gene_type:complete